jgi:hypothetical protein
MRSISRLVTLLTLSTICACGGGGGGGTTSSASINSTNFSGGGSNVVAVSVDAGPTSAASSVNIPYVSLTVCAPGSTTDCATIDHVLVDTGSYGLRLMASVVASLSLTNEHDASGNSIVECLPFADGYVWGPVTAVDLSIGGERAAAVPTQIIDDASPAQFSVPSNCSGTGASLNSVDSFDANGILGVGTFAQDCGTYCVTAITTPSLYYGCSTSSSCAAEPTALAQQVVNPVVLFAKDNNGVVLQLGSVASTGAVTGSGYLAFGIGTQTNNGLGSASVLTTDANGNIITTFNGQLLNNSFIDSGSNAYVFSDSSIPTCTDAPDWYCPTGTLMLSATNQGANGTTTQIDFNIANFDSVINTVVNGSYEYAFSNLGATNTSTSLSGSFDWGLPFFFGRTVYTAIEAQSTPGGTGPYFAYQ